MNPLTPSTNTRFTPRWIATMLAAASMPGIIVDRPEPRRTSSKVFETDAARKHDQIKRRMARDSRRINRRYARH